MRWCGINGWWQSASLYKSVAGQQNGGLDRSCILAEVSGKSCTDIEVEVKQSILEYFDHLDREFATQPGFRKVPIHTGLQPVQWTLGVVVSIGEISAVQGIA